MEYKEYIDRQSGNFIIADSREFENTLDKRPLEIGDKVINANEYTDLYEWYDKPLRFCGFHDDKLAVFYLGSEADLFTEKHYYDLMLILTKERIGTSYKLGTFRDCFLVKKNNKKIWK